MNLLIISFTCKTANAHIYIFAIASKPGESNVNPQYFLSQDSVSALNAGTAEANKNATYMRVHVNIVKETRLHSFSRGLRFYSLFDRFLSIREIELWYV